MQVRYIDKALAAAEMERIGVSRAGIRIMKDKCEVLCLKVDGLTMPAANILKQEMLAIGGDAALERDAVYGGERTTSALLMATSRQYRRLIERLPQQPFKLAQLAGEVAALLDARTARPEIVLADGRVLAADKPLLMGILNVTPDSFHDGGCYFDTEAALVQVDKLIAAGADIIDIGGASSRPGHTPLSAEEEWLRLQPLLTQLQQQGCAVPLSVDTDQVAVARAALEHGVDIINYVGGDLNDEIFALAAATKAPLVLMHRAGTEGEHGDICAEVADYFRAAMARGVELGMDKRQFILDPGPGFNKSVEENLQLMQNLSSFAAFGLPLLSAFSHKRFISAISGGDTAAGNAAAAVWSLMQGAMLLRVHDVAELRPVVDAAWAIKGESR